MKPCSFRKQRSNGRMIKIRNPASPFTVSQKKGTAFCAVSMGSSHTHILLYPLGSMKIICCTLRNSYLNASKKIVLSSKGVRLFSDATYLGTMKKQHSSR